MEGIYSENMVGLCLDFLKDLFNKDYCDIINRHNW